MAARRPSLLPSVLIAALLVNVAAANGRRGARFSAGGERGRCALAVCNRSPLKCATSRALSHYCRGRAVAAASRRRRRPQDRATSPRESDAADSIAFRTQRNSGYKFNYEPQLPLASAHECDRMRDCAQLAMRTRRPRRACGERRLSLRRLTSARRNVQAAARAARAARAAVALRHICHSRGAPFIQTAAPPAARSQLCKPPPLNATAHKRAAIFATLGGERRGKRANKSDAKVWRQLCVTNHLDTARDLAATVTAAAVLAFAMAAGATAATTTATTMAAMAAAAMAAASFCTPTAG